MPAVPPREPLGCGCSWRYSRNQTAMFTALTRLNRPHHQATGFDQTKIRGCAARHSKLINCSACNRTEI